MVEIHKKLVEILPEIKGKFAANEVQTEDGLTALQMIFAQKREDIKKRAMDIIEKHPSPTYLNLRDKWNSSIIHDALEHNATLEVLRVLVKSGASLNLGDRFGDTALHIAIEKERKDLIVPFVQMGADINHKNQKLESPIGLLLEKENMMEIIEEITTLTSKKTYQERLYR